MRYPRFTWFEVSNLNITCDFNQRYHGTLCFSWRWTGHSWPTSSAVCPRLARWRKHGCQTWCWGDYGDRTSHQQIPAAVGEAREKGFKDLATLLSQLSKPEPAHVSTRSMSVAEARGYGGWFSPSTWRRSGRYVHPVVLVRVAPLPTHSGPQVTNQGYPGLSQFVWWYPCLTPDIRSNPVFRWTIEVRRGVTGPAAAARQPGAEMIETYGMSTSEGISQDNSVWNSYPDLARFTSLAIIPTFDPNFCLDILSQLILGYHGVPICETYTWISRVILTCQGYLSFPDDVTCHII